MGSYSAAQVIACLPEPHTLPDDLQSTLDARVSALVDAQAEAHWNEIDELLGTKDLVSKNSYRECLISRMQEIRMVRFDLFEPSLYTCTTKRDLPPGILDRVTAEELPLYVRGTATFQTSSESWQQMAQIRAYRYQGRWYLVPPQSTMQDKWEQIHYTRADFTRDYRDEIDIRNSSSSPLEISDLHSYMDPKSPSSRDIKFTLRNRTSKNVVQLGVRIGIKGEQGFSEKDGPYQIKPKGSLTLEHDDSAYGDYCQGEWKREIFITEVEFSDGSRWEFKKPTASQKTAECEPSACP